MLATVSHAAGADGLGSLGAVGEVLAAPGPSADRGQKMDLYGWLVGSWKLKVTEFGTEGSKLERDGEWHFWWVLEGRAIQDAWIVPSRGDAREGDAASKKNYYGTTLRTYDPKLDAWHIQWTDPVSQTYLSMIGRKVGDDIVQEGGSPNGSLIRWSFSEIKANSFHWRGEVSADKGAIWRTNVEFSAERISTP